MSNGTQDRIRKFNSPPGTKANYGNHRVCFRFGMHRKIANFGKMQVMQELNQYITIDKEIAAGTPVFKGTRVAVKTLFDYLEESSLEEFLRGYPTVSREQAEAIIELAAAKLLSDLAA